MSERWLVIDASRQGELRIAWARPGVIEAPSRIARYDAAGLCTFTDALLAFERDTGTALLGAQAALAVAGAVTSDTIKVARSRWVLSLSGIAALFGRPVIAINEVAAQAWAASHAPIASETLQGGGAPSFTVPGRTALITIEEGVGAALINVDVAGHVMVLDAEMGHCDFAPAGPAEAGLARGFAGDELASWEQMLMAALGQDRPGDDQAHLARLIGRFAGNTVLALGAWRGVLIAGRRVGWLTDPNASVSFRQGSGVRRNFRRQLQAVSFWLVDQREPVLTGLTAVLSSRQALRPATREGVGNSNPGGLLHGRAADIVQPASGWALPR